jgi:hypothetical protein
MDVDELDHFERGFVAGVLAAQRISAPTLEQFRAALRLLVERDEGGGVPCLSSAAN